MIWTVFVIRFGRILLYCLDVFCYRVWRVFGKRETEQILPNSINQKFKILEDSPGYKDGFLFLLQYSLAIQPDYQGSCALTKEELIIFVEDLQ